jgi:ABC-2 type transport system permease protein
MEWCRPVPADEADALSARCPELTLRAEPAHQEAFVKIGDGHVTSEYRFGTIRPTILFNPARSHVLTAKVVAGALAGIAFGVLGEAIGWAIGYAILDGRGITVVLSSGDILLLTLGGLAGAALWGAIGAGIGAIIHNQVGGVITLLAWGLVVDNLLFGLVHSVGRFTPTRASDALMGLRVHHLVSPGTGAITLIAWAGAA